MVQMVTAYAPIQKIGMQAVLVPKLPKGRFKKALIKIFLVEHTHTVKPFLLCVNIVLEISREQRGRYL